MRKSMVNYSIAALVCLAAPALTVPALAEDAPAATSAHYSVSATKIGTLIDDPAAAAILKALIPTVWANEMFQSIGRDLTLKDVQQYEQVLTDEKLAEIQAAFDKLGAKD
jgi:hypothetical protein